MKVKEKINNSEDEDENEEYGITWSTKENFGAQKGQQRQLRRSHPLHRDLETHSDELIEFRNPQASP